MKTLSRMLAALTTPLLAVAAIPARASFDAATIPADARWVLHLDVDAVRSSALGRALMALVPPIDLGSPDMPVAVSIPRLVESITSATAHGTMISKDADAIDGTLVIRGSEELRKIVQALLVQGTLQDADSGGPTVKELTDLGAEAYLVKDQIIVALPPGDAIFVSRSRERLAVARATLGNPRGSIARAKDAPLAALLPRSGEPYLLAASLLPREADLLPTNGPQARILQMAAAFSIALGDSGPMTTARIQIDAASADMADRLVKILQGMVAMLSFAETSDEALAAFLRSVTVEKTSTGALVNLAYPTDRLGQMIKTLRDNQPRQRAEAGHRRTATVAAPVHGTVLAEWVADQQLGSNRAAAGNILTRRIENVTLTTGATLWLNAAREQGENGRFDYLEVTPADDSGQTFRFEAENMRLSGYEPETASFASGGELIILRAGTGSARVVFPGAPGAYHLTIGYVDEDDGRSPFNVSLTDPAAVASPPEDAATAQP